MSTAAVPRGRRLEPDVRREQILSCALRLFERRPYAEVSTGEIARTAGVARALVNHYFGTKRGLYLEVVRRLAVMPPHAVEDLPAGAADDLPDGDLEIRVAASIERLLGVVARHHGMWLATVGGEGLGRDEEVEAILREADEIATDRVLAATGMASDDIVLRAVIRSYGALVKAATREWLVRGTLCREQVHMLLTRSLLTLVSDTVPLVRDAATPGRGWRG